MAWPTISAVSPLDPEDILLIEDSTGPTTKYSTVKDVSALHAVLVGEFTETLPEAQPIANNTWVTAKWSAPSIDTGTISGVSADSTKFVTLPSTNLEGMWQLYSEIELSEVATVKTLTLELQVNGAVCAETSATTQATGGRTTRISVTGFAELESGDYVQTRVLQNSGGAETLLAGRCWALRMGPA